MQTGDFARYDALQWVIFDTLQQGSQPKAEWLFEVATIEGANPDYLSRLRAMRPEFFPAAPPPPASAPPPPPPPEKPRAAQPLQPGERVPILIDDNYDRVTTETIIVLAKRYCVFQAGGRLVEIQRDAPVTSPTMQREVSPPRLVVINAARARAIAARECSFYTIKRSKDGESPVSCPAPDWLGQFIVGRPNFDEIPVITALAQAPTVRRDGGLIIEVGYDASGIYLAQTLALSVPDMPTRDDARAAMQRTLDIVRDFDFSNPAGAEAWLVGPMSIACRNAFAGSVPMIIIDSSKKGAGKTLLADLASIIAVGTKAARMVFSQSDEEMDKRITSLALAADPCVLVDNVVGRLASPSLDAALTSESYRGRVLGKSEMTASLPMKMVWFATGNGVDLGGGDTGRRALFVRLEPLVDRPEDRRGPRPGQPWTHPDIIGYVTQNRSQILGDILTMVRAYVLAGRPDMDLPPMGSFESWSATIRSAIVWSGGKDPCRTVNDAREADQHDLAVRRMVECWPVDCGVDMTTSMLLERAGFELSLGAAPAERLRMEKERPLREQWRDALLEWLPARRGDLPTARELGCALRELKGAVIGPYRIKAGTHGRSGTPWTKERIAVDTGGGDGSSGESGATAPPTASSSLFAVVR